MSVLASIGSWLPFAIITLIIVFFSITFNLRYQQKRKRDYLVTTVCSISLIIALLTASLLPTDVILTSFMKNPDGTYRDWAQNQTTRDAIQKDVEISYYVLYSVVIIMTFLVNPFLFFFYEEKEELDEQTSKKICAAIKWTLAFMFFLLILILLGIFIPQIVKLPTDNSTEWDDVKYLFNHFDASRLQDSISFTIFTISIIGFFLLTMYTGYGSIALPLNLIRGKRSARLQQENIEETLAAVKSQIQVIKGRYPRVAKMPVREKNRLEELEQEELALSRNEQSIKIIRQSFWFKFRVIYRPMQIISGILLSLIALLIFISLLLSNINKCIHFTSFQQIFAQGNKTLPNPIDIILTWTGHYYPMSYIVLSLLLVYIIFTSIFGLQQLGIWCLCVRMYRFSRGRTKPQAILILSSLMMFIVIAMNIFIYLLIPQYAIYGDQHYVEHDDGKAITKICIQYVTADQCQMTVMGRIILRFFYKVWFFGAVYFILSWIFLFMFIATCIVKLVRNRESNIHEFSVDRLLQDGDDDEDLPLIQ